MEVSEVLFYFSGPVAQNNDNIADSPSLQIVNAASNNGCFAEGEERFESAHARRATSGEKNSGNLKGL
jgi:hypothetical protein